MPDLIFVPGSPPQEIKIDSENTKINKSEILFRYIRVSPLLKNFLFITKQEFFIFLDKLSKVNLIEVKKDLTKLCNKIETLKNLNAFKN